MPAHPERFLFLINGGNTEKVDRVRPLTPPHITTQGVVGDISEETCTPIGSPLDLPTKKAVHKLVFSVNKEGLSELIERIENDTDIPIREKDPASVVFVTHDVCVWHPNTGRILEKPLLVRPWITYDVPRLSDSDIVVVGSWARMFPLIPEEQIKSFDYMVHAHTKFFTPSQIQEFLDEDVNRYDEVLRTAGGLRLTYGSLFYEGDYQATMVHDSSGNPEVFAKGTIETASEDTLWRLTFGISDQLFEDMHTKTAGIPRCAVLFES